MIYEMGTPSTTQKAFLRATQKHVAFGGARGGGKSWAVRQKAVLLCLKYPGIRVLIVRRTYPELINNHITILRSDLYGIAKYNDKDKVLKFPSGSTINFAYCDRDSDLDRLQGVEYDVIFLDEATQLSEYQMLTIEACLRGANNFPKRIYYTCNPGGQGHAHIKRLFVDRQFRAGEDPDSYVFIQSKVTDNTVLMAMQPDYIKQLEALPPKLRDAWLYGKWDIFEGQFFEEFRDDPDHHADRRYTHVITPFLPPCRWTCYMSMDWGYARPFSVGWWVIDDEGRAYRILEWYGCQKDNNGESVPNEGLKMVADDVFKEIHRIEVEHPYLKGRQITRVADPAMWDAQYGESIAETAAKHGVLLSPADHKRLPGWMQMHYRLRFDEVGKPMLYVFENCRDFIRTIPLLQYDQYKVEDLDTEGEDHAADEARYFCMARPISPRSIPQADPLMTSPLHTVFGLNHADLTRVPYMERTRIIGANDGE